MQAGDRVDDDGTPEAATARRRCDDHPGDPAATPGHPSVAPSDERLAAVAELGDGSTRVGRPIQPLQRARDGRLRSGCAP